MRRFSLITRTAVVSAVLAVSGVATAGEADRARTAIIQAQAKIDAGDKVGAAGEAAEFQSRARAALQSAQANLARGKKGQAISDAQHASEFADLAIVHADQAKVAAERSARRDAEASAAAAQESAADARDAAVAADARAASAQQAAATANAQADALRAVPPAPTVTTVSTVEKEVVRPATPVRRTTKRVVRAPVRAVEKTTTVVTTQQ